MVFNLYDERLVDIGEYSRIHMSSNISVLTLFKFSNKIKDLTYLYSLS